MFALVTQGLIAIMAQWGLTADQLLPTIDKINRVADDFAVTSQDLVDGLNRSSGAAKVLGLNLDETIAILTVMREATGRTGKEVGRKIAA
jgi:TP901 family phage tail tape measure protein